MPFSASITAMVKIGPLKFPWIPLQISSLVVCFYNLYSMQLHGFRVNVWSDYHIMLQCMQCLKETLLLGRHLCQHVCDSSCSWLLEWSCYNIILWEFAADSWKDHENLQLIPGKIMPYTLRIYSWFLERSCHILWELAADSWKAYTLRICSWFLERSCYILWEFNDTI